MAKYKTTAEAQQDLARQLQEKAALLRPIYDSTDPVIKAKADALKADINHYSHKWSLPIETPFPGYARLEKPRKPDNY